MPSACQFRNIRPLIMGIIAIITSIALFFPFAFPQSAFAAEETRIYTWGANESQPNIPTTIEVNGKTYTLKTKGTPVQSGSSSTVSQSFSKTVEATYSGDASGIQNAVPTSVQINQDGYSGSIPRTHIEYQPFYVNQEQSDSTTQTKVVASQDSSSMPYTWTKNGHALTRTSLTFTPDSYDSYGNVVSWVATAQYYGTWVESVIDHYNVTGYYSGTLSKTTTGGEWSISCVYENKDVPSGTGTGGTISTFSDIDSTGGKGQAMPGNTNSAFTSNSNANSNSNQNANASSENISISHREEDESNEESGNGFPITYIILGVAAVVAIVALFLLIRHLLKNRKKKDTVAQFAPATPAPAVAHEPDTLDIKAELIEYFDDGTGENQSTKAILDVQPARSAEESTYIFIPAPPVPFAPANGADYYIVISSIEGIPSNELIIVAASTKIYEGYIDTQIKLDASRLTNGLNNVASADDQLDLSAELATYSASVDYGENSAAELTRLLAEQYEEEEVIVDAEYNEEDIRNYVPEDIDNTIHWDDESGDYNFDPEHNWDEGSDEMEFSAFDSAPQPDDGLGEFKDAFDD